MSTTVGAGTSTADVTPLDALRWVLERRALEHIARILPADVEVGPGGGELLLSEVKSFREVEPELLRELVVNLLAALHSRNVEAALWIKGDGERLRFFLGQYRAAAQSAGDSDFLRTCAKGFLKGAEITQIPLREGNQLVSQLQRSAYGAVISGIPSKREGATTETRLDEALEALARKRFELVVRFTPVATAAGREGAPALEALQYDLAAIVNAARAFASLQETTESAESFSQAFERTRTLAHHDQSIRTATETDAIQHSRPTAGNMAATAAGSVLGALVALATGPAAPLVIGPAMKIGASIGSALAGNGEERNETSWSKEERETSIRGREERIGRTVNRTHGGRTSISLARVARQAEQIEDAAEHHLHRVQRGCAVGAFLTTVVVAAENPSDVELVAHTLVGPLRGDRTFLEPLRVTKTEDRAGTQALLTALTSARPLTWRIKFPGLGGVADTPSTLLTSEEAAFWLRPPSHPIAGVSVRPNTRFHRTVPAANPDIDLAVGRVLVDGLEGPTLYLRRKDLQRHCFIAGTTGSGKTTTIRTILRKLDQNELPFLLVEPAKSEYRDLFDELVDLHPERPPIRLVAGAPKGRHERQLAFNPFRPVAGLPVDRYVGQMRVLLQSCFSMQESLPQILEALVDEAYRACGLGMTEEMPADYRGFVPTFQSMLRPQLGYGPLLDSVLERLRYGREASATLRAALQVRLESFTKGVKAEMFAGRQELDWQDLLERPCFIELSDVSDPSVRRFILGALVLRIAGEREAAARRSGERRASLKHVLVLEEAHHFLREPNGMAPGAELVRHSNELLADALAELRSYGQGIMIADQGPADLAPSVLRNTLIKIAHGLMYEQDCQAMGDAMGIDPRNRVELRRLRPGECLVTAPDFDGPVHVKIDVNH